MMGDGLRLTAYGIGRTGQVDCRLARAEPKPMTSEIDDCRLETAEAAQAGGTALPADIQRPPEPKSLLASAAVIRPFSRARSRTDLRFSRASLVRSAAAG